MEPVVGLMPFRLDGHFDPRWIHTQPHAASRNDPICLCLRFFAIHDHALLLWHPEVEDWAVFCGLTGAASKEVAASDRSNTFQVTFPKLKHLKLKLQGESRKEVAEWMGAISTASRKLSGALGVHSAPKDGKVAPVYVTSQHPSRVLILPMVSQLGWGLTMKYTLSPQVLLCVGPAAVAYRRAAVRYHRHQGG
jgi:hypothetical protein